MELPETLALLARRRHGVLVTKRRDGDPQLSNVLYQVEEGGTIAVSITADRAKYHNIKRAGWAALHVSREDFYAYAVVEGDASVGAVATAVDDPAVDELVALYRALAGEHDDWDAYRRAMVEERRVIARLVPRRAYGMWPRDDG